MSNELIIKSLCDADHCDDSLRGLITVETLEKLAGVCYEN